MLWAVLAGFLTFWFFVFFGLLILGLCRDAARGDGRFEE